eukprot:Rhum_TRINITY_DN5286_c0_g1::Rhum_TRINITY_DN5286_c0_g1_i1::g.17006::m.17006
MVVRPSRVLLQKRVLERNVFGGARGAGIGAPTRGLGRFFQRSRALYGTEPMYAPHRVHDGTPNDRWNEPIFQNYNTALAMFLIFFVAAPFMNSVMFYCERTYTPDRVPLPGCFNNFTDLDDPDWRLKRQMHQIEAAQGPRPTGYNRYLDMMATIKVSDPAFKPIVPKDHGETIGPNAIEIIERQNRRYSS